jgi:group II intron reverse transcriptase/maturase
MQRAEVILTKLYEKSKKDKNYTYKRLYRNLYNPKFYLRAYRKIYNKPGNMTPGVDNKTIDGFRIRKIHTLIEQLKEEKYYPEPAKRIYISKKNGKKRPLGIPSFKDKLIQEVLRQILESIYEPWFSDYSHGFRTGKSCHTALKQIKDICSGSIWCIEGDIKGFFDNIDHKILISILKEKIKDNRIIELIRRFLKAGYIENGIKRNTITGSPQGSIISPILANIYLNELDKYLKKLIKEYTSGKNKRFSKEYRKLSTRRYYSLNKGNKQEALHLLKEMRKIPSKDPYDENFKRIKYIRYADDFVIFIIGNKQFANMIKEKVSIFLKRKLNIDLNEEKTITTHMKTGRVRFLGYDIKIGNANSYITKFKDGVKRRAVNGIIQLLVPNEIVRNKIKQYSFRNKPQENKSLINYPVLDILYQYNAEIRGLYNYYCLANNVSKRLYKFKYFHYQSLLKTIANKEKSNRKKVIRKYGIPVIRKTGTGTKNIIAVKYKTKKGEKILTYFDDPIIHVNKIPKITFNPEYLFCIDGKQLIHRLTANECELCRYKGNIDEFEVHHIRKLKDLKMKWKKRGKDVPKHVLIMSKINRKTLVVCKECHKKIHKGQNIEVNSWRAVCMETCMYGSEERARKPVMET